MEHFKITVTKPGGVITAVMVDQGPVAEPSVPVQLTKQTFADSEVFSVWLEQLLPYSPTIYYPDGPV